MLHTVIRCNKSRFTPPLRVTVDDRLEYHLYSEVTLIYNRNGARSLRSCSICNRQARTASDITRYSKGLPQNSFKLIWSRLAEVVV